jgi:hypothetical protein
VNIDNQLDVYIERQLVVVDEIIPDADLIDKNDFVDTCLTVLSVFDHLASRFTKGRAVTGLNPGAMPGPELWYPIWWFVGARIRSIKTGATEHFVDLGRPPAGFTTKAMPLPGQHALLDPTLEKFGRALLAVEAKRTPAFALMLFEIFCENCLNSLAERGLAVETKVNVRSVWRSTKKLRTKMKRMGL